jgi:hypothetical protein
MRFSETRLGSFLGAGREACRTVGPGMAAGVAPGAGANAWDDAITVDMTGASSARCLVCSGNLVCADVLACAGIVICSDSWARSDHWACAGDAVGSDTSARSANVACSGAAVCWGEGASGAGASGRGRAETRTSLALSDEARSARGAAGTAAGVDVMPE